MFPSYFLRRFSKQRTEGGTNGTDLPLQGSVHQVPRCTGEGGGEAGKAAVEKKLDDQQQAAVQQEQEKDFRHSGAEKGQRCSSSPCGVAIVPAVQAIKGQAYSYQKEYRDKEEKAVPGLGAVVAAGPHAGGDKDHQHVVEQAAQGDKAKERIVVQIYVEDQP